VKIFNKFAKIMSCSKTLHPTSFNLDRNCTKNPCGVSKLMGITTIVLADSSFCTLPTVYTRVYKGSWPKLSLRLL
jgi:hypothetical protein